MEIDFTTAFESWNFVYSNKQSKIHSGIYVIFNNITKKFYIGSSYNIKNRLYCHFFKLKNNKHPNIHLQRSYNKHDKSVWSIGIIEFCEKEKCIEREQYYLDLYKSFKDTIGYNICITAKSNLGLKASEETKKKMSESSKGHKKNIFRDKSIHKFVHKSGIIEELSIYELCIKYNLKGCGLGKLLNNKTIHVRGWYLNNIKKQITHNKLNINEKELIEDYNKSESMEELCKKYNCSDGTIRNHIIRLGVAQKDFRKYTSIVYNKNRNRCINCKKSKDTFEFSEGLYIHTNCII